MSYKNITLRLFLKAHVPALAVIAIATFFLLNDYKNALTSHYVNEQANIQELLLSEGLYTLGTGEVDAIEPVLDRLIKREEVLSIRIFDAADNLVLQKISTESSATRQDSKVIDLSNATNYLGHIELITTPTSLNKISSLITQYAIIAGLVIMGCLLLLGRVIHSEIIRPVRECASTLKTTLKDKSRVKNSGYIYPSNEIGDLAKQIERTADGYARFTQEQEQQLQINLAKTKEAHRATYDKLGLLQYILNQTLPALNRSFKLLKSITDKNLVPPQASIAVNTVSSTLLQSSQHLVDISLLVNNQLESESQRVVTLQELYTEAQQYVERLATENNIVVTFKKHIAETMTVDTPIETKPKRLLSIIHFGLLLLGHKSNSAKLTVSIGLLRDHLEIQIQDGHTVLTSADITTFNQFLARKELSGHSGQTAEMTMIKLNTDALDGWSKFIVNERNSELDVRVPISLWLGGGLTDSGETPDSTPIVIVGTAQRLDVYKSKVFPNDPRFRFLPFERALHIPCLPKTVFVLADDTTESREAAILQAHEGVELVLITPAHCKREYGSMQLTEPVNLDVLIDYTTKMSDAAALVTKAITQQPAPPQR